MRRLRLTRMARGAVIALALALLCAAPAVAAQPTSRTVTRPTGTGSYSASGSGCGFAVSYVIQPGYRETWTEFSDGTEWLDEQGFVMLTNPANGKTFLRSDHFHGVVGLDALSGLYQGVSSGQQTWSFLPGDVGPYGPTEAPGLGVYFDGTVRWSFDANNVTRDFSFTGTVTDVCALLS